MATARQTWRGYTSSASDLLEAVSACMTGWRTPACWIRRLTISANRLLDEISAREKEAPEQLDLFTDYAAQQKQAEEKAAAHAKERKLQEVMLGGERSGMGKNAILKGMNLEEGATAQERNRTIGGQSGMKGPYDDIIHLPHPTSRSSSPDARL